MDAPITVEKAEKEITKLEARLSHVNHRIGRLERAPEFYGRECHLAELTKKAATIEWEIGVLRTKMVEIKGEASTPC